MENLLANEMNFKIGDVNFRGFKFTKNVKHSLAFYESLVEDDNMVNRLKFKNAMIAELKEEIHIKISTSVVLKHFAYLLLGVIALMVIAHTGFIASAAVMVASVASMVISSKLKEKAEVQEMLLSSDSALDSEVDMMFFKF